MSHNYETTSWKKSYWCVGDPIIYTNGVVAFDNKGIRPIDEYFEYYDRFPPDMDLNQTGIIYKKAIEVIIDSCLITDDIIERLTYV